MYSLGSKYLSTDVLYAQITSIGSGISVSLQTAHGLGRDIHTLANDQIVAYHKVCPNALSYVLLLLCMLTDYNAV